MANPPALQTAGQLLGEIWCWQPRFDIRRLGDNAQGCVCRNCLSAIDLTSSIGLAALSQTSHLRTTFQAFIRVSCRLGGYFTSSPEPEPFVSPSEAARLRLIRLVATPRTGGPATSPATCRNAGFLVESTRFKGAIAKCPKQLLHDPAPANAAPARLPCQDALFRSHASSYLSDPPITIAIRRAAPYAFVEGNRNRPAAPCSPGHLQHTCWVMSKPCANHRKPCAASRGAGQFRLGASPPPPGLIGPEAE